MLKRLLPIFVLLLMATGFASAQSEARVDTPIFTNGPTVPGPGGLFPQTLFVANATVQVCQHPATLTSCTPVTTYTDATGATACPSATPLVQLPGTTCTASAGVAGNVGFWYAGGIVDYIVTAPHGRFGPYTINPPFPTNQFLGTSATLTGLLTGTTANFSGAVSSQTVTTTNNIDDTLTAWPPVGWKPVCVLPGCNPGGTNAPASTSQTINNATPSLDGASMFISETTAATSTQTNALWVYIAGICDSCTTLTSDFNVYIGSNGAAASSFEFDSFNFDSSTLTDYMFGLQCNQVTGFWQYSNQVSAWVNTTLPCSLSYSTWHHIVVSNSISGTTQKWNSITIDGVTTNWNLSQAASALPSNFSSAVGLQFQIDIGATTSSQTVTENLDNVTFTVSPTPGFTGLASLNLPLSGGALTGPLTALSVNGVAHAASFAGADCGAKIGNALASLGAGGGIVQVDQTCGTTWTTAVTLGAGQTLQFTQGGTYSTSAQITLTGTASGIVGLPCRQGWAFGTTTCPVVIFETNGANLTQLVQGKGPNEFVKDIEFNGNASNQTSGGIGINVTGLAGIANSGMRFTFDHVYAHNFKSHGGAFTSTAANNEVAAGKVFFSTFQGNLADGFYCQGTGDAWFSFNEFESNASYGLELNQTNGCPSPRIKDNDMGGNGLVGLYIGAGAFPPSGQNSAGVMVLGNQFGNNFQGDISLNGYSTISTAQIGFSEIIANNVFVGLCAATSSCYGGASPPPANTWNAINVVDGAGNSISNNVIYSASGGSTVTYKYGIQESQTHTLGVDLISSNIFVPYAAGTGFGTGYFTSANTSTQFIGNVEYNSPTTMLSGVYVPNNTFLMWKDSGGTQRNAIGLDNNNVLDIFGQAAKERINLQPNPAGSSTLAVSGPLDTSTPCGNCYAGTWFAPTGQNMNFFFEPNATNTHELTYVNGGAEQDFNFITSEYTFQTDSSDNWTLPKALTIGGESPEATFLACYVTAGKLGHCTTAPSGTPPTCGCTSP